MEQSYIQNQQSNLRSGELPSANINAIVPSESSTGLPVGTMCASTSLTFSVAYPGRLLSDQDRSRSVSTGAVLTNPVFQGRLCAVHKILHGHPAYGPGETEVINGIKFTSLFRSDWQLEVTVQFFAGSRIRGQQADADNWWKPVQNALAFPSPGIRLPSVSVGSGLYTVARSDHQFTAFAVRLVPFPVPPKHGDMTLLTVTALPPPHLALTRQ